MRISRQTHFISLLALTGVLVAGCVPTAPTVLPEVTVEHAGSSDLDDNEYVVGLRASELARAMAWNSGDFSIASLAASTVAADVDFDYDYYKAFTFRDWDPEVYVGPRIWAPISVEETPQGVELTACYASQDRVITKKDPGTDFELLTGQIVTWTLVMDDEGRVSIDDTVSTEEECDPSAAEVLTFDPEPTLPEKITEGDIRAPK